MEIKYVYTQFKPCGMINNGPKKVYDEIEG